MSAPVDVLAVMDAHTDGAWHQELESRGSNSARLSEIREEGEKARAAVAELIELVGEIDDECGNSKPNFGRVVELASKAAALARVGGAA